MPGSAAKNPYDRWIGLEELSLHDLEAARLLLRGDSSVDWHRLSFQNRDEVEQFFRAHLFDLTQADDRRQAHMLQQQAVGYLRNQFNIRLPQDILAPKEIHDLFLHASFTEKRFNRRKLLSCMLLKVMNIIHHLNARQLVFRTAMSDADMFTLVESRIAEFREGLERLGAPVLDIYGSRKSQDSLISKLLSKRETFTATIFDTFRYRIVVKEQTDLLPLLSYMIRTFIPFNYVLPTRSFNNLLLPQTDLEAQNPNMDSLDGLITNYRSDDHWGFIDRRSNEFSASTYRMINFCAELPVPMDAHLEEGQIYKHGRLGCATVEMQIVDEKTEMANDYGDNSHDAYKARRKERVLERLRWGGHLRTSKRRRLLGNDDKSQG